MKATSLIAFEIFDPPSQTFFFFQVADVCNGKVVRIQNVQFYHEY